MAQLVKDPAFDSITIESANRVVCGPRVEVTQVVDARVPGLSGTGFEVDIGLLSEEYAIVRNAYDR